MGNINVLGGIAFGLVIGFLSWYAVFPTSGKFLVTWKTLSAFLGIVGGGVVTSLFPANSESFGAYSIGLCLGFFYSPTWSYISEQIKMSKPSESMKEIQTINSNWSSISNVIAHKLNRNFSLGINALEELPYSYNGKISILRKFAELYIKDGVELKREGNDFRLIFRSSRLVNETSVKYLGHASTKFKFGYDDYDESWTLESPDGEFLGECGVTISKHGAIDDSLPRKVRVLEVWLFDKSDIRTITKCLLSENAYLIGDINSKILADINYSPILAREADTIVLDTVSLMIKVEIMRLEYVKDGKSQKDIFKTVGLEIEMWSKSAKLN